MIKYIATRIHRTDNKKAAAGAQIREEGTALVYVKENGELVVKPSTGADGEIFAGLSTGARRHPQELIKVESHVIPATGFVELARVPKALAVWLDGTMIATADIGANPVVPANGVNVVGNKVYAAVGSTVKTQYSYEPTVSEAQGEVGDLPINGDAEAATGRNSFVTLGTVATTMFDATVDWTAVVNPRLGADGKLTTKGIGTLLSNVLIENAPSAEADYLEVSIKAL